MNILAVLGSPKLHGNAGMLLDEYLKGVLDGGLNCHVDKIYLHGENIKFCTGCCTCKTGKITNCILNDNMRDIYPKIEKADVVIFSTPIYFYGPTAQTKVFMDRLYAVSENTWQNKKYVSLITYGDKNEQVSGAVNWKNILNHLISDYEGELVQSFELSTGSVKTHKPYLAPKVATEIHALGMALSQKLSDVCFL